MQILLRVHLLKDSILHLLLSPCGKVSTKPNAERRTHSWLTSYGLEDLKNSSVSCLSDVFSSPPWLMMLFRAPCLMSPPGGAVAGSGPGLSPVGRPLKEALRGQ